MTEKQYGGSTGRGTDKMHKIETAKPIAPKKPEAPLKKAESDNNKSEKSTNNENFIKAGKIAAEVVKFAKSFIKKDMLLLDIANKIDDKILELKGKPAFPVNLSIDEVAAHDTPSFNDTRVARGLLKVDIGVQIEGCIADTAFSLDLEGSEENKKLITTAEKALLEACKIAKVGITTRELGLAIETAIKSAGFSPINNLSGHSMEPYELHAGITIPNRDNSQEKPLDSGVYAIEPFATTGLGSVRDGKLSGIYRLEKDGMVRDTLAREVLAYIYEEYQTLPFCSRGICKKFGARGLIAIKRLDEAGLLHQYPQLIEVSGKKVSQAEHTVLLEDNKKVITTI